MKKLWECSSYEEQKEWCRQRLLDGATLTDPGLFVAGANPTKIIRALRKEGLRIETVYVETVDAANQVHPKTLAWRLKEE